MIQLLFSNLNKTYPDEDAMGYYRKLLQIEGEFEIILDGVLFFHDPYMSIIELAKTLMNWLKILDSTNTNLEYIPIESDDKVFLKLTKVGSGWQFDSQIAASPIRTTFTTNELLDAFQEFLDQLEESVLVKFGENIYALISI